MTAGDTRDNSQHVLAGQLRNAGFRVHFSRGVWWHATRPGFAKPVDPLLALSPGSSFPSWWRTPMGYSHVIPSDSPANRTWAVMALGEEALLEFRLQKLRKGRQSAIKQALKALEFADLVELGPHLDAMALICASQAERTQHGRPPEFYVRRRKEWERAMQREFSIPSRVWLGAFSQGRLIGYYYAYLISGTLFIAAAKSHTEALHLRPNDGMLYTLLERCRANDRCRQVVFGDCSKNPSLDDFKESYGFRRLEIAVHRKERWLLRLGSRVRAAVAGNSR